MVNVASCDISETMTLNDLERDAILGLIKLSQSTEIGYELCDQTFSKNPRQIDHMKLLDKAPIITIVAKQKPFTHKVSKPSLKCNECNYFFSRRADYERHLNSCHLKLGPFKCTKCKVDFSRKDSLQRHLRNFNCE